MDKIVFVTTNKHKFNQISLVLLDYNVVLEQLILEYPEDKEKEMKEISLEASKNLAEKLKKPVIVEDSGLYFEAYNNFPGAQPKFVYNSLGFKGIFKLLEGESRKAYFKTVIGYCEPGSKPVSFEGIMHGKISDKIYSEEKDGMPYEYIFIPDGHDRVLVDIDIKLKNSFSQRGQASRSLGEYLKSK